MTMTHPIVRKNTDLRASTKKSKSCTGQHTHIAARHDFIMQLGSSGLLKPFRPYIARKLDLGDVT